MIIKTDPNPVIRRDTKSGHKLASPILESDVKSALVVC